MNKKCSHCGMINFENAVVCKRCKEDISQAISSEQAKAVAGKMFCKKCGALSVPKMAEDWGEKDSVEQYLVIGWVLWLLLSIFFQSFLSAFFCIVLGIAGTIYRLTLGSAVPGCSVCGAKRTLIPAESPLAQQFLKNK